MRENEISLRKWSGGTAQLRTLEGTLIRGSQWTREQFYLYSVWMLCFNVYFCVFKRVLFFARCRVDSAFESSPRDWTSSFATLLATSSSVKPPVLSPLLNHAVTGWWGSHEVAEDIINVRYISDNLFWPFVVSADNVAAPAPPASLPWRSVDAGGFIARKNNKIWEKITENRELWPPFVFLDPRKCFAGREAAWIASVTLRQRAVARRLHATRSS